MTKYKDNVNCVNNFIEFKLNSNFYNSINLQIETMLMLSLI